MFPFLKILIVISFFYASNISAQITFQKLYNFSQKQSGYKVVEQDSNQYLFLTYIADCALCPHTIDLIAINQFGDTVLNKWMNYGNEATVQNFTTSGKSILLPITARDSEMVVIVLKLDSVFAEEWQTVFSIPGRNLEATGIVKTNDGGTIICGHIHLLSNTGSDLLILKLDSLGNIQWHKAVNFTYEAHFYSVIELINGDLLFAGGLGISQGRSDIIIYKTNLLGDSILTKTFTFDSVSEALFVSEWRNQFILGGYTSDSTVVNSDGLLFFLNSNLDSTSAILFDLGFSEAIHSSSFDSLEFVVSGCTFNTSLTVGDIFILKVDTNKNIIGNKVFNGPDVEFYYTSLDKTSDNGLIIGGTSGISFPSAILLKTDNNGEFLALSELDDNNRNLIFPNPSNDLFYIKGKEIVKNSIVFSLLGEKIIEFSGNEIDLTNYSPGIYIYQIHFLSGKSQMGKVIKTK